MGASIQEEYIQIVINHAGKLHSDNIILHKFKKAITVIIHELEYYDIPLNWTKQANPGGLATAFERWVNAM